MKIDTHLHGDYSADSTILYEDLCEKAISLGYGYIAITEHYDLLDSELADYGVPSLRDYKATIERLREKYPQIYICFGLEYGDPHRVYDLAKKVFSYYQPEYLIGSLHNTRTEINVSLPLESPMSEIDIMQYYMENLEMVQVGGFDTLGHLGIYKRGMQCGSTPDESNAYMIIDEIFRLMIKKNIALEVNNSAFKSNFGVHLPEPAMLQRYKKLGGELICVSSDSHNIEHFDKFYNKTLDNLRDIGFNDIHYKKNNEWMSITI